jgi:uncharacterized phiE125 gp8 family phage protein
MLGRTISALNRSATDYLSIAELKRHLQIDENNTDHDAYLADMLPSCFDLVDSYLGYSCRKSTVAYLFDDLDGAIIHIPARLISISSVKYLDVNGDEQTLATTEYQELNSFSSNYGFDLEIINAPTVYDYGWKYKVTVVEGFEPSSAAPANIATVMPDAILHAVKLIAAQYWANRMAVSFGATGNEVPFGFKELINRYKVMEFV